MPLISVVSPVYNEEACLPEFCRRLHAVLSSITDEYEIVLVDDGSRDRSWSLIAAAAAADARIKGVRFSRNFGHHVALSAGLDHCSGEYVVTLDSDLQDQPEEIPRLYQHACQGYDVVLALREGRRHGVFKQFLARCFYTLFNHLSDGSFDPRVGVYRIMSRRVVVELARLRENARFFSGLVDWVGFSRSSIMVTHAPRFAGESKYPLMRQLLLAFDAILGYTERPLRLAVYLGLLFTAAGILWALRVVLVALLGNIGVSGYASIMSAVLVVGGVNIATVGIVGLYVGRIFREVKRRPLYVIAEACNAGGPTALVQAIQLNQLGASN